MEKLLSPRLLDRERIDQAFPLVRNLVPKLTLERWTRFARPQIVSRSSKWPRGLMTIQKTTGDILGLFGFEVRSTLNEGRELRLDNVLVPDIPGRDLIWISMIEAAEQVARVDGCFAIRAEIADYCGVVGRERAWAMSSLRTFGYSVEGLRAIKRLSGDRGGGSVPESDDGGESVFFSGPRIIESHDGARKD